MSAALPGYVYFDPNFKFHDGTTGRKLFVVLCDSPLDNEFVVVARTTSTRKNNIDYGCELAEYPPCFFLPEAISDLDKDSWIMLDYVVEYDVGSVEKMTRKAQLSIEHTIDLLKCGSACHYLAKWEVDAMQAQADLLSR